MTSPVLFNLYVYQLIDELSSIDFGCYIDLIYVNNQLRRWYGAAGSIIQGAYETFLSVFENYARVCCLKYNPCKNEIVVFKAETHRPAPMRLKVVDKCKYMGHIVTSGLKDDQDMERERRKLTMRGNMLTCRFAWCKEVKITLFRAYYQSFHSSSV